MRVESIFCSPQIEEKLQSKHRVEVYEVRQILLNQPRVRYVEKGHTKGDDVYAAFGQTFSGRYLSVFYIYRLKDRTAIIVSARDMSSKERRAYGRK